jgi:hypothetical protein
MNYLQQFFDHKITDYDFSINSSEFLHAIKLMASNYNPIDLFIQSFDNQQSNLNFKNLKLDLQDRIEKASLEI